MRGVKEWRGGSTRLLLLGEARFLGDHRVLIPLNVPRGIGAALLIVPITLALASPRDEQR